MRLIPAHAGKTRNTRILGNKLGAHPRSRGENQWRTPAYGRRDGSSPLTRGKRAEVGGDADQVGLIPAHAGKTPPANTPRPASWAHPRSRGEN